MIKVKLRITGLSSLVGIIDIIKERNRESERRHFEYEISNSCLHILPWYFSVLLIRCPEHELTGYFEIVGRIPVINCGC